MFYFIEKIRKQPLHIKKQIAFLVAFSTSGIIFVIWLSVIYPNFRNEQKQVQKVASLEPSPISTFRDTLGTAILSIYDQFGKIKETLSSFSTDPEYYSTTTSDGGEIRVSSASVSISTTTEKQ